MGGVWRHRGGGKSVSVAARLCRAKCPFRQYADRYGTHAPDPCWRRRVVLRGGHPGGDEHRSFGAIIPPFPHGTKFLVPSSIYLVYLLHIFRISYAYLVYLLHIFRIYYAYHVYLLHIFRISYAYRGYLLHISCIPCIAMVYLFVYHSPCRGKSCIFLK